ncbi:hypothetical protein [Endozoicomonas ascidiicola]|uniref:hypothetical protein n=1 Tax=Endozoicomonas ascidiicola TaxID=1698521 RepID=UPI00082D0EAA|nr:hypothetical protein [Endozoicomonas ascidiicola]
MDTLTAKQIANRAYYARNAETIKARKREQSTSKAIKPAKVRKAKPEPITIKPDWQTTKTKKSKVNTEYTAQLEARRRIEDIQMARELGITVAEL